MAAMDTQLAAFQEAKINEPNLRVRVFDVLKPSVDGMTSDEVASAMGLHNTSVRPVIHNMVDDKILFDTGIRRPSRMGRPSAVWKLVENATPDQRAQMQKTLRTDREVMRALLKGQIVLDSRNVSFHICEDQLTSVAFDLWKLPCEII